GGRGGGGAGGLGQRLVEAERSQRERTETEQGLEVEVARLREQLAAEQEAVRALTIELRESQDGERHELAARTAALETREQEIEALRASLERDTVEGRACSPADEGRPPQADSLRAERAGALRAPAEPARGPRSVPPAHAS